MPVNRSPRRFRQFIDVIARPKTEVLPTGPELYRPVASDPMVSRTVAALTADLVQAARKIRVGGTDLQG
jgi:hypothetical protein